MKKFLAALLCSSIAVPAAAAEHITSLGSGTVHSGITWDGAKYVFSNVYGTGVDFGDATIQPPKTFHYLITTTGVTQGTLRIDLGAPKTAAPVGINVLAVNLNGAAPIADNFPTANGVGAGSTLGPDSSTDVTGAFRSRCGPSRYAKDDPVVYPKLSGRSHLHEFFGNDGVNAYSTEKSLRLSGGSSCSAKSGPVYRSAIWQPAMLDGVGGVKRSIFTDVYYKQVAASNVACQALPDATHIGICVGLPNHIRWVIGYNMANGTGGPTDPSQAALFHFVCDEANNEVAKSEAPGVYTTLTAMYTAGCRSPATIGVINAGPACWDGVHLDTPDHRSHVSDVNRDPAARVTISFNANGTPTSDLWAPCPVDHPYVIPVPELHSFYVADAAWDAGKWRLSCDEQMGTAMAAGTCLHNDYWEAWSPTVKNTWVSLCINLHEHCSDGNLGDGTGINFGGTNGMRNFSLIGLSQGGQIPMTKFGYSRYITTSGTFTGEITPADGGNISIEALDGFTGNVTAFSITDVTRNTNYSSATTAHTSIAGTGAVWTPPSAGQPLVAWYDPSDITLLFKDSSCTIPVTTDGDFVHCMKGKSGIGPNLIQTSPDLNAPIYRAGAGKPYLDSSSGGRWLESGLTQWTSATDGSHTGAIAWYSTNNTGSQHLSSLGANQSGIYNLGGASQGSVIDGVGFRDDDAGPTITVNVAQPLINIVTASTIELFVNNSSDGATSLPRALPTATTVMGVMEAAGGGFEASTGRYYGSVHYSGALSSGDRTLLNTYLLSKMP